MEAFNQDLASLDLAETLRSIYLERASGVLEISGIGGKKRLFFLDGELHLSRDNPLAGQLANRLGESEGLRRGDVRGRQLMGRMATVISTWREGEASFSPDPEAVPADAVGPLPTAELVMATAVQGHGESTLLARLGGVDAQLISSAGHTSIPPTLELGPAELQQLDRLAEPASVDSLLHGDDRRRSLEILCRLQAVGLIDHLPAPGAHRLTPVSPRLLQRFLDRVGLELDEEPLELSPERHRAHLAELFGDLGEMNYYQLLAVSSGAGGDEIHAGYTSVARLVHPRHTARLGFEGRDGTLQLLFERATEAYLVLSDPVRRGAYDREMQIQPAARRMSGDPAADEKAARLARAYYVQARDLVEEGEYHYALELLQQAVQSDDQAEYHALMGQVLAKNPNWQRRAIESYRRALHLDPQNVEVRLGMGRVFERLEDRRRALAVYRSALLRQPGNSEAAEAVHRLEEPEERSSGFFRLFGRD